MRKRLRWAREDDVQGLVRYTAKRKREKAFLVPNAEGGYTLIYQSVKCKRKVVVANLQEGRDTAEVFRNVPLRRNPLALTPARKTFLYGGLIGAGVVAAIAYAMNAKASTTAPKAVPNLPATQIFVTVSPGNQSTSYNGGTMFASLPASAQGWTSANNVAASGTNPLQLPTNPVGGPYLFTWIDSTGAPHTTALTVTAGVTQLPQANA
jgi:hypothetical protein